MAKKKKPKHSWRHYLRFSLLLLFLLNIYALYGTTQSSISLGKSLYFAIRAEKQSFPVTDVRQGISEGFVTLLPDGHVLFGGKTLYYPLVMHQNEKGWRRVIELEEPSASPFELGKELEVLSFGEQLRRYDASIFPTGQLIRWVLSLLFLLFMLWFFYRRVRTIAALPVPRKKRASSKKKSK